MTDSDLAGDSSPTWSGRNEVAQFGSVQRTQPRRAKRSGCWFLECPRQLLRRLLAEALLTEGVLRLAFFAYALLDP